MPVVVCMTHADLRYNECMDKEDGNPDPTPFKIQEIGADLMVSFSFFLFFLLFLYIHCLSHPYIEKATKDYTSSFTYGRILLLLFASRLQTRGERRESKEGGHWRTP